MANLRLEAPVSRSEGHKGDVLACTFTPDNAYLLSAGWDGTLRLWDSAQGIIVDKIPISDKPLSACLVAPDNKNWLVGTMDGLLACWDPHVRMQTSLFLAHTRPISALMYSPDGQQLASASWDRHVNLWNLEQSLEGKTLGTHGDIVSGCRFTPDGKRLVSWSYDTTSIAWDVAQKRPLFQMAGHTDRINTGSVSPDGRWLLTGARNGEVILWDLQNGQSVNSIPLGTEIRHCSFLLDAETAVVINASGHLTLHQIPTLQIRNELDTRLSVQAAALSPSGGQIALGCSDGQVNFVAVEGFDNAPLAITATQSVRVTATMFQRLFGKSCIKPVFACICPACRAPFELEQLDKNRAAACPQCRRSVRICAVTEAAEPLLT